jgi:hypothetical protein
MEVSTRIMTRKDVSGNTIIMKAYMDENNNDVHASFHLKLASENRLRLLGDLDIQKKTFYCKRKSEKHLHYKSNSYGFNWEIINEPALYIKKIALRIDDESLYIFPKSLINTYGTFLNFKQQGFELQRFIRMDLIKQYKVE